MENDKIVIDKKFACRSPEDVLKAVKDENISFVQFWFTDVLGVLKSFAITPSELEEGMSEGMGFDGSSIEGFARIEESDMSYGDYFISPTDGHLSPFGHGECAAWLAEILRDLLDLPGKPPSIHLRRLDLLRESWPVEVAISGLGASVSRAGSLRRDGTGPASVLAFRAGPARRARIETEVASLVPDQELEITVNDEVVSRSPRLAEMEIWGTEVVLPLQPGRNVIALRYREWNGRERTFNSADRRPSAVRFHRLVIDPDGTNAIRNNRRNR